MASKPFKVITMKIKKTKRFQDGKFNFSIKYKQFQYPVQKEDGTIAGYILCHSETAKYIGFPDLFGTKIQVGVCDDTADYYRQ